MTPVRRRSILLGATIGLVVAVVAAVFALRTSDTKVTSIGSAEKTPSGSSGIALAPKLDGKQLPQLDFTRFDGTAIDTAQALDKPLVINIWQESCKPCKDEMPAFEAVHRQLGDRVRIVGVDSLEPMAAGKVFAAKLGIDYELWSDPDGNLVNELGILVYPATIFVAAGGRIVKAKNGAFTQAELTKTIDALFPP